MARVNTEEISIQVGSVNQSVQGTRRTMLIVIVLAVVTAIAIGVVVSRSISRRVIKLRDAAAEFGKGKLNTRTDIKSSDEIGELALSFNTMAENLEKEVIVRTRVEKELRSHRDHLEERETELRTLNESLEERVAERTRELSQANQDLGVEVAERRQAEVALEDKALELVRSNSELEQFASVASHDLQEPLRKIQAFGDLLAIKAGDELNDQNRNYLHRMKDASSRMQDLINGLLTLSRVGTRSQPYVPVDLYDLTQEVLSDLEVRIEQSGGRVEVGALPVIEADALQMRQLMQNLISNALKFQQPEEPPVVKVESRFINSTNGFGDRRPEVGSLCELTVQDNGIGFDEKYAERIFGIFQRLHARGAYEGTGIGLATCRKIVERHGGIIEAKSAPGEGATFVVTIPVEQPKGEELWTDL